MKKHVRLALLMALFMVSVSSLIAMDQTIGARWGLGYPITDVNGKDTIHPMFGASWEGWMNEHVSVGVYPYLTNLESRSATEQYKARLIGGDVMVKYRLIKNAALDLRNSTFAQLSPFGMLGIGATYYTTEGHVGTVAATFDKSKVAFAPTAALGISLVTNGGVSADLGGKFVFPLDDKIDMVKTGSPDAFFTPYLGIGIAFGGKKDADGDKILDANDGAPADAEDYDGFQDTDGIPDLDNDGDKIPDIRDGAPNDAEDYDGFQDNDGIPDRDNDKDGIPDIKDGAPNAPEDFDGIQDTDGIPDLDTDRDKDGIIDSLDGAPDNPEDRDGFKDSDGIPDPDNDNDGILDVNDKAPGTDLTVKSNIDTKETYNGFEDADGVPDVAPKTEEKPQAKPVEPKPILKDEINMEGDFSLKGVQFDTGSANLTANAKVILDKVVESLKAFPNAKFEIQGHTDNQGSAAMNDKLSQNRAISVKNYLISKGISGDRFTTKGFGFNKPIATNDTPEGRAENRRIEFIKIQ